MKNIFLVGMPSSGKSTLGRRLARALDYRFVDLDKLIVENQNQTIPEIFRGKGEGYFREVERKILQETTPDRRLVVATGGGAPCFFDNMDFIKANGLSIFLDVPPRELAKRILNHNKDDRPLLSGIENLEAELTQRRAERLPFYEKADLTVSQKMSVPELVQMIKSF